MLDLTDRQVQLVGMLQRFPAELAPVIRERILDIDVMFLPERQHSIMQHIDGSHRDLRQVQLPKSQLRGDMRC